MRGAKQKKYVRNFRSEKRGDSSGWRWGGGGGGCRIGLILGFKILNLNIFGFFRKLNIFGGI